MPTTDELSPGRVLDALVAEKVMGLKPVEPGTSRGVRSDDGLWHLSVPFYSTFIAAAWDVVTKLRLAVMPLPEGWRAVQPDGTGGVTAEAVASSAPLAICRVALDLAQRNQV